MDVGTDLVMWATVPEQLPVETEGWAREGGNQRLALHEQQGANTGAR